jgi:hypothetical protein
MLLLHEKQAWGGLPIMERMPGNSVTMALTRLQLAVGLQRAVAGSQASSCVVLRRIAADDHVLHVCCRMFVCARVHDSAQIH